MPCLFYMIKHGIIFQCTIYIPLMIVTCNNATYRSCWVCLVAILNSLDKGTSLRFMNHNCTSTCYGKMAALVIMVLLLFTEIFGVCHAIGTAAQLRLFTSLMYWRFIITLCFLSTFDESGNLRHTCMTSQYYQFNMN